MCNYIYIYDCSKTSKKEQSEYRDKVRVKDQEHMITETKECLKNKPRIRLKEPKAQGNKLSFRKGQMTTEIIQKRELEEKDRLITQMKKDLEGKDQVILKMKKELERKDEELKQYDQYLKQMLRRKNLEITNKQEELDRKDQVLKHTREELEMSSGVLKKASDQNVANRLAMNQIKRIITKTEIENN